MSSFEPLPELGGPGIGKKEAAQGSGRGQTRGSWAQPASQAAPWSTFTRLRCGVGTQASADSGATARVRRDLWNLHPR